jgi:hypothetical protein
MPFDYQTLKNLRTEAIVDSSIGTGDMADSSITATQIATSSITAVKIGSGAVDLASSVVTGALPVSKGGIGLTTFAGANRAIYSDGSNLSFQNHGIQGLSVFTGNNTWNRPAGVRYIRVQVQAGAGGGSGHGEGGGAGGYSERFLDVTGISSVSVTIGGEGGGTYYANAGGDGGASSFGPYCSASGGHGANRQNQHSRGVSGVGSGGNLNLHMGGGLSHHAYSAQSCADTYFGGGAVSSHPQGGHFAHNHQGHSAPGSGGAGAHFHGHRGSNGRPGIIIVTNYY